MTVKISNPLDHSSVRWEELKSDKGFSYQVGFPEGQAEEDGSESQTVGGKKDFGIGVSWPPTGGSWVQTPSIVRARAAITRYSLGPCSGAWKYELYFTNTEHYHYYFYDETGDYYGVNTFRNGDHYVRYNSSAPDIVYISGR